MKNDPELEKMLAEYENAEKQLQMILIQKQQMQLQTSEITLAVEELVKAKGEIYKSIGAVMVKSNKEDADKDLKERKERLDLKMTSMSRQEEKLRQNLSELQKKLQMKLKGAGLGGNELA